MIYGTAYLTKYFIKCNGHKKVQDPDPQFRIMIRAALTRKTYLLTWNTGSNINKKGKNESKDDGTSRRRVGNTVRYIQ